MSCFASLQLAPYLQQQATWPQQGQVIMAQYDDEGIYVYQAYNRAIGHYAAEHGHFGGDFSFHRMSWIKPNFLWMMYRSGWGTKPNQEVTLAIKLRRAAFEQLLQQAVASSFAASGMTDQTDWQQQIADSDVRLQWDPDHDPYGAKLNRRAVQIGIRGNSLVRFSNEWIMSIEDISPFVAELRQHVQQQDLSALQTPLERVFR